MKIFVSGLPRSGKTTLIKKIVELLKDKKRISGFYTEEKTENQKRIGFEIFSIDLNKKFLFASKFIKTSYSYAGYYLFLENLEKVINHIDINSELIVIDEIGKMEMISEKFKSFIYQLFRKRINLVATLHREFIEEFSKYGKVFWLRKERWNETFKKVIKVFNV